MNEPQGPSPTPAEGGTDHRKPGDPRANDREASLARWPVAVRGLLWAAVIALAACTVYRSVTRALGDDECEAVHRAWLVSQGERPYLDFFEHHHPLLYFVLSPVIGACGERIGTLIACRLVMLVLLGGVFAATYGLAARLFDRSAALLAVLFLMTCSVFLDLALEIRPDVPQTLFGLLAMVSFFRKEGRVGAWGYFFTGMCLGVAMLFLQKAIFTIAALGTVLVYRLVRKEARLINLVACAAGGLLALLPFGVWLVGWISPREYFFLNWTLNMHAANHVPFSYPAMMYFNDSRLLFVFAAIGVACFLTHAPQRELVAVAAALFGSLWLLRGAYEQYWLPLIPLVAILAGQGLAALSLHRPRVAVLVVAFLLFNPVARWVYPQFRGRAATTLRTQWERTAYVLSLTGRSDCVCDDPVKHCVLRRDIDYFWFGLSPGGMLESYQALRPYPFDIYQLIAEKRPKVISSYGAADVNDPRIQAHYQRSDRYDDLFVRRD